MRHENNGDCPKCKEIMSKFAGINEGLKGWFVMFQAKHPEAHISCAGRGKDEQEQKVREGKSRAHYGKSAHNYNCAIDIFEMAGDKNIYEKKWFKDVLAPEIPYFLKWYGEPGSSFYELPHLEVRDWRELKAQDLVSLVE